MSQGPPPAPQQGKMAPPGMPTPGSQPSPEQIEMIKKQLAADAEKAGMSVPEFVQQLRQRAVENQIRMQQQMQAQGGAPGAPRQHLHTHPHPHPHPHDHQHPHTEQGDSSAGSKPIVPGPPNPAALALAAFLRAQDLKPRVSILSGERKEMFRVKRALRAMQSPAYEKARKKNPLLPKIIEGDRASLENAFKLLPMSMLALRVIKIEPDTKPKKRTKGFWTVKIEPEQEAGDDMYYCWMWEGSQLKRKIYAVLALVVIFAVVCYPLWPLKMRQGVYYLSWGFLGLLALFFIMAIFRVILFCVTYFVLPPGLWLYPNLWEDVSFMDSFRPVWAWHETGKKKKKLKTSGGGSAHAQSTFNAATGQVAPATATTTATATQITTVPRERSYTAPKVEELVENE